MNHPHGALLAAAGLYELRRDLDVEGGWLWTATIATRNATDALGHIHDRCPVLVPADRYDDWLDPGLQDLEQVAKLVASLPEPHLQPREVTKAVGSVRNNGPQLVEPVA